jgi:hypothetical protein
MWRQQPDKCRSEILGRTHQFLQVFSSSTLWVEGDRAGLSQTLEMMDAILAFFEQQKVREQFYYFIIKGLTNL